VLINTLIKKIIRRIQHLYVLANAPRITKNNLLNENNKKLLILCYGNIYRSPFVECYLKSHNKLPNNVLIKSSGFHPVINRSSPKVHIQMAAKMDVDLSLHRSTIVNQDVLNWADLIIIMDRKNWDQLSKYSAAIKKKIIWLGVLKRGINIEIKDPYGHSEKYAWKIMNQLKLASDELIQKLYN